MSYHIPVDILFDKCEKPPPGKLIVEPFTGDGQVLQWLGNDYIIIAYDSEPSQPKTIKNDVFESKVRYVGSYVITRIPQLKKSESQDKHIFIRYGTDNLYKCFINFLIADQPQGGIIVVPLSFLNGTRDSEIKRRLNFFIVFKGLRFNVFDINTVVIQFIKRTNYDSSYKDLWSFNFYEDSVLNQQIRYSISQFTLPGANHFEFSLKTEVTKKIYIRYDEPTTAEANETVTYLVFDEAYGSLGIDSIANKILIIKGHVSNRLQENIMNAYNTWIETYNLNVHRLFRKPITVEVRLEAIRRIIYENSIKQSSSIEVYE